MYSIAIFGGTFDPVHNGHIKTNLAIQKEFNFDSYRFIPCKLPAIKPASTASAEQRVEMLHLAIKNYPKFEIDLREINRSTPSYMVETLESLRVQYKEASITLILGYDAFSSLPKWHQWQEIIKFANLLVINRETFKLELSESLNNLMQIHLTKNKKAILKSQAGLIYIYNAGAYSISSTQIRAALKEESAVAHQLPKEVEDYIRLNRLYC